ncbi:hypothetical protein C8J57DRAFT_1428746 [Mycena rebaudengoi]|nr:hypothetical protein C8J57DRAFT_1428746 [Mycena rebaudengoi]
MTDVELAAFEVDIAEICAEHEQSHGRDAGYRACAFIEAKESKYFIKFDAARRLRPEFTTQSYIHDYAARHENGPRIPQALHYFETNKTAFLRTAQALDWLSKVSAPSGDVLGPIGGGLIRHRFFKHNQAPLAFSSIDALERYMNQGRKLLSRLAAHPPKPIIIIHDPLIFTQSDMRVRNFGVDKFGDTVLLDFGQIGRLPLSFVKHIMGSDEIFISSVANLLCLPDSPNMNSMARVSGCLWMTSDTTLGAATCV